MERRKIIKIVNLILIAVMIVSIGNLAKIYYDYNKADTVYGEIQNQFITYAQEALETQNPLDESVNMDTSCAPITIDFDSLNKRNNDVVGWLYCPDTVINYPVVQGEDNNQYLRRDLDGNYLRNGTLFADYRNNDLSDDENYIIYGHNMKNGTMFNTLVKYKDQEYYDRHPVMYYLTPDGDYKLELFAGLVVRRDDGIYSANSWQEDKTEFLNEYLTRSTFQSEIAPSNNDVIVTLSTCSYEFDNARYVVIGRLIAI